MIPRALAAILIVYSTVLIQRALPDLPERIPTRFDLQGHPTSVSRPETIWLFLAVQALLAGMILVIPYLARRRPQWVSLGSQRLSDLEPPLRVQVSGLIDSACGWLAVGFMLFMAVLIRQIIRAALELREGPGLGLIVSFFAGLAALLGYYFWKYRELVRPRAPVAPCGGVITSRPPPPPAPKK